MIDKNQSGERIEAKPFLKWAGGKRWLVSKHPELFNFSFKTYFEPFLGSGAVFFHLKPENAVLSDLNSELINTYSAIKSDWEKVYDHLVFHQKNHSREYYYKVREQKLRSDATKAARLIYLNRTCWNGLYRVNKSGEFNVPIGTKTRVVSEDDCFQEVAQLLRKTELLSVDFEKIIDRSKKEDFLFVDPPYTIKHNYNGFIKYNENLFSWDDQIRLRDALLRASKRGVRFLVTNACHESVKSLYESDFVTLVTERSSVISGASTGRGTYEELLISSAG
jgi:DNA adenine methylase